MFMAMADSTGLQTAFSTGLTNIQTDVLGYIAVAVPVALVIVGSIFGIKKAVSFFKGLANK